MVRIKTTTSKAKEFLSPFIFTEGAGKSLISKLILWHKIPVYELETIAFENCPVDCLYNQTWGIADIMNNLPRTEKIWRRGKK